MTVVSSIDWAFLEVFFGEYGKLITAALALLVAAISFGCSDLPRGKLSARASTLAGQFLEMELGAH